MARRRPVRADSASGRGRIGMSRHPDLVWNAVVAVDVLDARLTNRRPSRCAASGGKMRGERCSRSLETSWQRNDDAIDVATENSCGLACLNRRWSVAVKRATRAGTVSKSDPARMSPGSGFCAVGVQAASRAHCSAPGVADASAAAAVRDQTGDRHEGSRARSCRTHSSSSAAGRPDHRQRRRPSARQSVDGDARSIGDGLARRMKELQVSAVSRHGSRTARLENKLETMRVGSTGPGKAGAKRKTVRNATVPHGQPVPPVGLEPTTHDLKGRCSSH